MALDTDLELGEVIVILAALGIAGYFVWKMLKSVPNPFGFGSASDAVYNAATGQLSCAQVEAAAQDEARQIVQASAGSITMADALKQARADQQALHRMQTQCTCYSQPCGFPATIPVL